MKPTKKCGKKQTRRMVRRETAQLLAWHCRHASVPLELLSGMPMRQSSCLSGFIIRNEVR